MQLDALILNYRTSLAECQTAMSRAIEDYSRLMGALGAADDRVQRLVNYAALAFDVNRALIISGRRFGNLPLARWAVLDALRRDYRLSSIEVAKMCHVDHGSVLFAQRRLADAYQVDPRARSMIDQFNHLRSRREEAPSLAA